MNPGRLVLEALRLDLEPEPEVRRRAASALALGAGGFILFGGEASAVARLICDLRADAGYPLLMTSDLERGPGQQFGGLPTLPPPAGLAAVSDPVSAAHVAGGITGRAARELDIDLVFAPALDLDVEPRNPIVGTRAFGADPETVASLGAAWIEGCQAAGVMACAKHFPGHGRTVVDSHDELPSVTADEADLEADLLPFARVAGDVAAILTAHVRYPALGSTAPATLAPEILGGLLRDRFGFEGLVVTDAMNMSGFLDAGGGAAAALEAGCDLLLYPENLERAIGALVRAAGSETAVQERVARSLARLEATRTGFRPASAPIEADREPPGGDERRCRALALDSVRWFGEPPAWLSPGIPVRLVPVWDDRPAPGRPEFGSLFAAELRRSGWSVAEGDASAPALVLVASTPQAWKGTSGLTGRAREAVREARRSPAGAAFVVFGHPRVLEELGGGLCAWATEPAMESAAARTIAASGAAA